MNDPFVTIDLHGLMREEAMRHIDMTLRDAGSGVYQVRLVHGYHRRIPVDRVDDPSGEYPAPITLIVDEDTVFADMFGTRRESSGVVRGNDGFQPVK